MTESYGTITITDTTDLEWFYGTILDGTGDAIDHQIILTADLVTGAAVGSMYLNTQTSLVYKCVAASDTSQTWQYVGSMTAGVQDEIDDASKVATNYIVADETGLMIAELTKNEENYTSSTIRTGNRNVFIDSNSLNIRDGQNVLASFGEDTIIGSKKNSRIELKPGNIFGYYGNHGEFFKFSGDGGEAQSLRHSQRIYYNYAKNFPYNDSNALSCTFLHTPSTRQVKFYAILYPTNETDFINFTPVDSDGNSIGMNYTTYFLVNGSNTIQRYFKKSNDQSIINIEISFNYNTENNTLSNIRTSNQITTQQWWLLVSIDYLTRESTSVFSIGENNSITGAYSTGIGFGLNSEFANQLVTGIYNNNKIGNLFEIGNGSSDLDRLNIFEINSIDGLQLNSDANISGNLSIGNSNLVSARIDLLSNNGTMSFLTSANNTGIWDTTNGLQGYWLIAHRFDNDHAYIGKYLEVPNNAAIKNQKMVYEAGDIISYANYIECAGRIAASGKTLAFQIPLVKPIASGRTLTLDTTNTLLSVYYYNGSIAESAIASISGITSTNLSNIGLTYSDCGIRVSIPKSTNWISSINYNAVTVVLHNLKITIQ